MDESTDRLRVNRRRFLTATGHTVALIPVLNLLSNPAMAAEKITEDHPTAAALGYLHDANAVDTAKYPKRAGAEGATQFCDNCGQYKVVDEGWGTCGIFPNYLVAAKGWCNVWVPMS